MALTRRLILGAAAAEAIAACPPLARAGDVANLRQAAARAGLLFGSTSDVEIRKAPPQYAELLVENCDLFAPQMQWTRTAPRQYDPDPLWEDPNIAFARGHGMKLTGGHLLWHQTTPSWFEQLPSRSAAEQAVVRHVKAMSTRHGPAIYSWNVVNEAIEPKDGRPDGLRNTPLLRILGDDFIATAFFTARQAAPHAMLVYNDYGFEFASPEQAARRTAHLRLLDKLQAARAPIDAVGLQSHMRLGGAGFDARGYRAFLREISERGLAVIISELDVLDVELTPSVAARDADVAALYGAFLETALDEHAVAAVVTWGLVDSYSWYNLWTDRAYKRWDHQPSRPLLFDSAFRRKPAFDAVLSAVRNAPSRAPSRLN